MNDVKNNTNDEYKQILATANKLEAIESKLNSVIEFFISPATKLYTKLCNDCMKLFFNCEFKFEQFRRAEDLVWRRVYHDIYRFHKNKRQLLKRQDEQLIETHLISGVGFYSSLIIRLRTHFQINDVDHIIEPLNLPLGPIDNLATGKRLNYDHQGDATFDLNTANRTHDNDAQKWAKTAIHRSLIYIGDLARYMLEISEHDFRPIAFKSYRSASRLLPEYGLPFNQLATLAGNLNHNLDAVCSYMRCCSRAKQFEGAEANMRRIFELNDCNLIELNGQPRTLKASDILASKEPLRDAEMLIRCVIVNFVKLTSSFWYALTDQYDQGIEDRIVHEARFFFETLRETIDIEPVLHLAEDSKIENEFKPLPGSTKVHDKPRYISATIMYEFSSIAIMLITKCQQETRQYPTQNLVDLINSLALNLLHYSTKKCQSMILRKLQDIKLRHLELHSRQSPCETHSGMTAELSPIGSQRSCENINSSSDTSRKNLSRLRKKKAAINYSDGNTRLNSSNDIELSELEETALSTIDALDISSEMSEGDDLIDLESSSSSSEALGYLQPLSRPPIRTTRSQNYEIERHKHLLNASESTLPTPDLLTGDLEFHSTTPIIRTLKQADGKRVCNKNQQPRTSGDQKSELEYSLAYVYHQTYLPTLKILFDWLLSNIGIIESNMESFLEFSSELSNTASLLDELLKVAQSIGASSSDSQQSIQQLSLFQHRYDNPNWRQKFPLSCDLPLINLSALRNAHQANIDFGCTRKLNDTESGYVTSQCILAFSHALTSFLSNKSR